MNKIEKIKRVVLIAIGFGLATYLLINGFAMLDNEKSLNDVNTSDKVHSNTMK
jgi:hypothetical protein